MGARSRKRRRDGTPVAAPRLRGEARNQQIREELEPLKPGERPLPIAIGAVVAALIGIANLVMYAAGYDLRGSDDPNIGGVVLFSVVVFAAAIGMWMLRYWAVLGFQCLLALTIFYAAASLAFANNVQAVLLCAAIVLGAGWLFWKLIRAMARLQMPERPGAQRS